MLDREEEDSAVASKILLAHSGPVDADLSEAVQRLKSVALLLKGLYGQINEEREIMTLASGQMAHSVQQFEVHLAQFESFEKACSQWVVERVKTELKQSIHESAQTIAQEVTDSAYEPINRGINSLSQLSLEMAQHRSQQKKSWLWGTVLFLSAALTGGVVSGFLVHYGTAPSKEIKVKLAAGDMLLRSWSALSQTEKNHIRKMSHSS